MTRSTPFSPLHPQSSTVSLRSASASMESSSYVSPSAYPCARAGWSSNELHTAVRADEPFSHESKCFILADMDKAARPDNEVCVDCAARLGPEQRRNTIGLSSGSGCKICDLKVSSPERFTKPFCDFLAENPTIFHTVEHFKAKMNAVGFTEVRQQ